MYSNNDTCSLIVGKHSRKQCRWKPSNHPNVLVRHGVREVERLKGLSMLA